jgi:hypothetical protein
MPMCILERSDDKQKGIDCAGIWANFQSAHMASIAILSDNEPHGSP